MITSLNIFTKCPYTGNPKSRLSNFLTVEERVFITKYMLLNILKQVTKLKDVFINLWVYPTHEHEFFQKIHLKYKINLAEQVGNSLFDRMRYSMATELKRFKKVVFIGSDIPSLTKIFIEETIIYLDKKDYVIGPSKDGGFYLLGAKNLNHDVFKILEDDNNSFSSIIKTMDKKMVSYEVLKTLKDIDTKEDLLFI